VKKLKELRDFGLITEEEFQTKKKELLAKIYAYFKSIPDWVVLLLFFR
jgi:hypothetical protein